MWPAKILEKIGPIIFQDDKPREHYVMYVKSILRPKWFSELSNAKALFDFRDYAEDSWTSLQTSFNCEQAMTVPIDSLLKAVKAEQDTTRRKNLTVSFLEENAYGLKNQITSKKIPESFIAYCIDSELDVFFKHARGIGRFRPLLKAPLDSLEAIIKEMETVGRNALTIEHFQTFAKNVGLTTLWPILAMWVSNERGDIEETFLHPPLPRIFGAPSCLRNAIEKTTSPEKIARRSRTSPIMSNSVLCGLSHIAWLSGQPATWRIEKHASACLVAPLPGMPNRIVWTLRPDTLQACIMSLEPFKVIAEFEVPADEIAGEPNWIDCQRDSEGSLVLLWGQINALTGNLQTQNMLAFDEDFTNGKEFKMLDQIAELPNRRSIGVRIDWRDHGNLLSIHHAVTDGLTDGSRTWTHAYEVVFGTNLLMTFSTSARPIEAIFGSPHDVFLLSPLSLKNAIQHWTLDDNAYKLKEASEVPKNPAGHWTSFCVA